MTAKKSKSPKVKPGSAKAAKREVAVDCDVGAPIERYRGENGNRRTTGDLGDIELETLDPQAPYNKTYGR